jgi:hypothetical protein
VCSIVTKKKNLLLVGLERANFFFCLSKISEDNNGRHPRDLSTQAQFWLARNFIHFQAKQKENN